MNVKILRRLALAASVPTLALGLTGCPNSNSATSEERATITPEMIRHKLCVNLLDQNKAKYDKVDRYDKDALGSYGYNFVLWMDLCTDSPAKVTEPDDASGGDG